MKTNPFYKQECYFPKIQKIVYMTIFFFQIEGGHLVNANWFVQTTIGINLKVCKAIQFIKRCQPTSQKNIRMLFWKEDHDGTLSFL